MRGIIPLRDKRSGNKERRKKRKNGKKGGRKNKKGYGYGEIKIPLIEIKTVEL